MSKEGRRAIDVGAFLRYGQEFLLKKLKLNNPVARLVNDAKGDELWQMLRLLRDSEYLTDFLRAVMELPMENWYEQKPGIHHAFASFNGSEIAELVRMYQETGHDSPVMAHLDYDQYWTQMVENEVKAGYLAMACQMLSRAKTGMANGQPIPGIVSSASKNCLAKLNRYINRYIKRAELSAKQKIKGK